MTPQDKAYNQVYLDVGDTMINTLFDPLDNILKSKIDESLYDHIIFKTFVEQAKGIQAIVRKSINQYPSYVVEMDNLT